MTRSAREAHRGTLQPEGRLDPEVIRFPQATIHLFATSEQLIASAETAFADRRMARPRTMAQRGGLAEAADFYRSSVSPHLLFVETGTSGEELFTQLEALADACAARTKLVVIGHINDIELYRELVERGVSDYIVAPLSPLGMIKLAARLLQQTPDDRFGRSLAFIGACGGAGSSTVAQNVAAMLATRTEMQVILADLDLAFGSSGLNLNLAEAPDLLQALRTPERLDEVLLDRLLSRRGSNLGLLPSPATLATDYDLEEGAFEKLLEVARSIVPYTVLDLPHHWSRWTRKLLLEADEIVITTPPTLVGLRNTSQLVGHLRRERANDPPPRLVLNQLGIRNSTEIKADRFCAAVGMAPTACLRQDPALFSSAANEGQLVAERSPRSPAAVEMAKIVGALSGTSRPGKGQNRWIGLWPGRRD